MLPSTPGEKQRERGEERAAVAQVQEAKSTAAHCCAAGTNLPGKELVATGLWVWFRQAGKCSGLASVHDRLELCARAALQGAALHSKAGSRRDEGCGVLGKHRDRSCIWKNILTHPVERDEELSVCLVVSMNWKHLVEPATALAEGAGG